MNDFFTYNYQGAPFELFGTAHLVALAVVLAINLFIGLVWKNPSESAKRAFRYSLAAILLVNESLWHWWNWTSGVWTIQTMLPLHLCSVLVFASAYLLITKAYPVYEFVYLLGIAGATQALLTPDAGRFGYPHFRFFQVIISHGAIVTTAIYLTAHENMRPTWRSVWRVILYTNIYMLFVGVVNWLIGSNYLFIARKPDTASLIDLLGPWPFYILPLELIGLVMSVLLYLPFALRDRRRQTAAAPLAQ